MGHATWHNLDIGFEAPAGVTRDEPIDIKTGADVQRAAAQASQTHTHEQGQAGNYEMGHATWHGLDIAFEAPAGGMRRGLDKKTGAPWEGRVGSATGFIKGSRAPTGTPLISISVTTRIARLSTLSTSVGMMENSGKPSHLLGS